MKKRGRRMLGKNITFIYSDSAERAICEPLAVEAKQRGYVVKLTDNPFEKCEIGIYCQHINFPQFSKFSVIMLHDIIQQYSNWPDIWFLEPWNKYDIGILPSDQWVKNWTMSSSAFYTRPRIGVFKIGWPKADIITQLKQSTYKNDFYTIHGLDKKKKTILYAPAWENDGKQDDFVQAMLPLNVNILIKQWDAPPEKFPQIVANINAMQKLHEANPRVTILTPSTNIFEVIAVSDILVSEESSTMCEAAMMGIPAVSVSDWLIPDVTPSRYPKCDYDFVTKTTKNKLSKQIEEMISDYQTYKNQTEQFAKKNFANLGNTSSMIIDIIDDYLDGNEIRYTRLPHSKIKQISISKSIKFGYLCVKRELYANLAIRYHMIGFFWNILKKIRRMVYGERIS